MADINDKREQSSPDDKSFHSRKSKQSQRSQKSGKLDLLLDTMRKNFGFCVGRQVPDLGADEDELCGDERSNVISTGMILPPVGVTTEPCCAKRENKDDDAVYYEEPLTSNENIGAIDEETVAMSAANNNDPSTEEPGIEEQNQPSEEEEKEEEEEKKTLGSALSAVSAKSKRSTKSGSVLSLGGSAKSKKKPLPSILSETTRTPETVTQGLIFPPTPRQTLDDMLSNPPREINLTLFTNDDLQDMFKPDTIIPNKNKKIDRLPSFEAVDNLQPSKVKFPEQPKSLFQSFASYFQQPEPEDQHTIVTDTRCLEPH